MALFLNLYLGHLLGDFLLQPGKLVAAKRNGLPGLLIHVAVIGACTGAILISDLGTVWPLILLAIGAHLLIEVITISARARTQMSGLSIFVVDQAMHIFSLVLLVWLAGPLLTINVSEMFTLGMDLEPTQLAFICGLTAVTFLGSILVFETVRALNPSDKDEILPYDLGRIRGIAERAAALMLAVLVYAPLIIVPFLPRVAIGMIRREEKRSVLFVEAATGIALCMSAYGLILLVARAAG